MKMRYIAAAALVGLAACTAETAPVEAEDHVQILQGDVVNHLVIRSLHEAGVNVAKRHEPSRCHARTERHCVLFSDSNVEGAVRHFFHHEFQAAS